MDELVPPPPFDIESLEQLVGTKFNNQDLYQRAFTHRSALKKYNNCENFETLEFLGDSVLGFIITKMIFDKYSNSQEGFMTKVRTKLVCGKTLASISKKLELYKWVVMDDKGMRNNWIMNDNILEDVFEAMIGAMYLDIGFVHVKRFVLRIFNDPTYVDMDELMLDDNYKDALMRYCQSARLQLPYYHLVQHTGDLFEVNVYINNCLYGSGTGKTKKKAEQHAAGQALRYFTSSHTISAYIT